MRQEDNLAFFFRNLANIHKNSVDAGRIGDLAVFHRDVEVGANEHPFAGKVHIVECPERGHGRCSRHMSFPMAAATSIMRFEKPHSLSYQDRTRTNVPSITLV